MRTQPPAKAEQIRASGWCGWGVRGERRKRGADFCSSHPSVTLRVPPPLLQAKREAKDRAAFAVSRVRTWVHAKIEQIRASGWCGWGAREKREAEWIWAENSEKSRRKFQLKFAAKALSQAKNPRKPFESAGIYYCKLSLCRGDFIIHSIHYQPCRFRGGKSYEKAHRDIRKKMRTDKYSACRHCRYAKRYDNI